MQSVYERVSGRPRPDFFIVGAPKCGTTAMYEYLRQHPQVFMPFHKEPLYFGTDLGSRYGRMSLDEYLALFAGADPGQRVGEASAWYLYSRSAAAEIRDFAPDAQVIIMLRNPVDMMHAQHSQLLFNRQEDISDFGEALDAEQDRRAGRRIPRGAVRIENLFYRDAARFSEQIERYLEVFGRHRIQFIVYEDLRLHLATVYERLLRFLRVDPSHQPRFGVRNANKRIRSPVVQDIIYNPPRALRPLVRLARRYPALHALRERVTSMNSREAPREAMDDELRARLTAEFADEVSRIGELIGRDLSAWSRP